MIIMGCPSPGPATRRTAAPAATPASAGPVLIRSGSHSFRTGSQASRRYRVHRIPPLGIHFRVTFRR